MLPQEDARAPLGAVFLGEGGNEVQIRQRETHAVAEDRTGAPTIPYALGSPATRRAESLWEPLIREAYFERHRGDPVPELEDVRGPIASFLRTLAAGVNLDRLVATAAGLPDWAFVLAGPIGSDADATTPGEAPNVRVLEKMPYSRLPP